MVSSSTFKTWGIGTWIWGVANLSIRPCVGDPSSSSLVSHVKSSVLIETSSINVHGNWNVVHALWSICGIIVVCCLTRAVSLVVSQLISLKVVGAIVVLEWPETASLIVQALEVSKHASLEASSSMREEGRLISLSSLIGLRTLPEYVLQ